MERLQANPPKAHIRELRLRDYASQRNQISSRFYLKMGNHSFLEITHLKGTHQAPKDRNTLLGDLEDFEKMSIEHRDQILFLDLVSTQEVYDAFNQRDLLCGDDGWGNRPFSNGCYRRIKEFYFDYCNDNASSTLKKWLYQTGIPFSSKAFLLSSFCTVDDPAILTTWKIIVKYAPEIFSGDNVVVVSTTANWCLHFHHDGLIKFAEKPDGKKMKNSPKS